MPFTLVELGCSMKFPVNSAEDVQTRAQLLFHRGDAMEALAVLDRGLEQYPADQRLIGLKLDVLRRLGRTADALSFGQSVPLAAQSGTLFVSLAELSLEQGDTALARSYLQSADDLGVDRARYLLAASKVMLRTEGIGAALLLFDTYRAEIGRSPKLISEYARLLAGSGQAEDAVNVLREAIDRSPVPALVLALIKLELGAGRLDRVEALLDCHAEFSEKYADWHLLAVRSADRREDITLALSRAEMAVQQFPDNRDLNEALWRLLARTGQHDLAVERCTEFADRNRGKLGPQLSAARFLLAAKQEEACEPLIARAEDLAPGNLETVQTRAQLLFHRGDAMGARDFLKKGLKQQNIAPRFQLFMANCEKALGNYTNAISLLEDSLKSNPEDVRIKLSLARTYIMLGYFHRARKLLCSLPDENALLLREKFLAFSILEMDRGRPEIALQKVNKAIECHSSHIESWKKKSQIELVLGRVSEALESHLRAINLQSNSDITGQHRRKSRNSIPGQILNEYRLLEPDQIKIHSSPEADQFEAMRYFRSCVAENPNSTAAALCLLGAIQRSGKIVENPAHNTTGSSSSDCIPKQVFQFWDTVELPDQVDVLIDQNRKLNPDFDFKVFNESEAKSYLQRRKENEALKGMKLAPHAAAKADIFRLAVLWHEGGIYMDVDDRCLHPLSELIQFDCRFIGYQEQPMMSVGNNFLAARPRDPIIRAALDSASVAFNSTQGESLWLSTGPGAITRAVALLGTQNDGSFSDGVWIMPMHRLRREVATHIRLPYKSTEKNWIDTFKMGV